MGEGTQKSATRIIEAAVEVIPAESYDLAIPPARPDESASDRLNRECLLEVVQTYLGYYASGDGHTARAKRYDLKHFMEFLAGGSTAVDKVLVEEWTLQSTKDFVDDRLGHGESPATVARRLATIKHLGRTLAERVPGYINPAREVKSPVLQQTRPHGLTAEEIELLRQAAASETEGRKQNFTAVRNQALLELLLATGLRADEVRLLFLSQISDDGCWLKNVKTKGRKFRNVYLDSDIRDLLQRYLEKRRSELHKRYPALSQMKANELGKYPVFVSTYSAELGLPSSFGLSPKSVWRIISNLGKKAQAMAEGQSVSRLHPHKLRHTFAHGLLDSSKDVRLVAQALGHSDVRTTMRYTERTEEELAKAIEEKISRER